MPLSAATDPKATYTEIATFDSALSEWSPEGSTITTGHYNPNIIVQQFVMSPNVVISKTFDNPIDISKFSEIAMWMFASSNTGRYLQLTIAEFPPASGTTSAAIVAGLRTIAVTSTEGLLEGNTIKIGTGASQETVTVTAVTETQITATFTKAHASGTAYTQLTFSENAQYSTILLINNLYDWEQMTWDISAIPASFLQNVSYFAITSLAPSGYAPVVAFEELVARNPSMLESVFRQIKYLFHEQVTVITNDNETVLVPALSVPEYDVQKLPAFVFSIGSAVFDTQIQGRVIEQAKIAELIGTTWKFREGREPYLIAIRVEVVANFQEETMGMQEFILRTLTPHGALSCAGDVIDCIFVSSMTAPTFDTQQRQFRQIYEYSLWTWLNSTEYTNIPALQSITFTANPIDLVDVNLIGVDEGIYALREHPDAYIEET